MLWRMRSVFEWWEREGLKREGEGVYLKEPGVRGVPRVVDDYM